MPLTEHVQISLSIVNLSIEIRLTVNGLHSQRAILRHVLAAQREVLWEIITPLCETLLIEIAKLFV